MSEAKTEFEQWAIVEIFGHQKYAGKVTEQTIGGSNFVRLDVPETDRTQAFTKLFGQGAIYCITPVEETIARHLAGRFDKEPVSVYELPDEARKAMQRIDSKPVIEVNDEDDFDCDF